MRIGIIVGLSAEARIARRLGWPVAIGGGTEVGAQDAARHLIDAGAQALISLGLAGGLDLTLRAGAILVPRAVITGDERFVTDATLARRLGGVTPHDILGASAVAASVADKRRHHAQTGASAIDLESGAVAHIAAARGVPFAVLRAVCDPADRDLPPAALDALDAHGAIAVWRVLRSLAGHPEQLPALIALARDAMAARAALATRVRQIAPTSTPRPQSGRGR
nr:hypothetical protein Hi04_10k_c377_00017 [uncultured bacterium]